MVALYMERRTLGLDNLVRLGSRPGAWPQVRVILACSSRMDPPAVEFLLVVVNPIVRIGRQAIYLGDLEGLRDLGTEIKRVRVVVGIGVLEEPEVEPALDGPELAPEGHVLRSS